jgi:hypothetical protein
MNLFTTDHPLALDVPRSRWRDGFATVLVLALVLFPFLLGLFWFANLTGNQDTTGYTPDPFWQVLLGAVVDSVIIAFAALGLYCLGSCIFRRKLRLAHKNQPSRNRWTPKPTTN